MLYLCAVYLVISRYLTICQGTKVKQAEISETHFCGDPYLASLHRPNSHFFYLSQSIAIIQVK